jgi:hypothetical protein
VCRLLILLLLLPSLHLHLLPHIIPSPSQFFLLGFGDGGDGDCCSHVGFDSATPGAYPPAPLPSPLLLTFLQVKFMLMSYPRSTRRKFLVVGLPIQGFIRHSRYIQSHW